MEKIPCICKMRELYLAISRLENGLVEKYGVSLNEAIVMCCIGSDKVAAGDISQATGIKSSNLSKVLRSIEKKGLITRSFGDNDKRQIYFTLTPEAIGRLEVLKCDGIPIPDMLKSFFK